LTNNRKKKIAMDPDKNLSGDSGGPGWQQRGQPDSPSEHRDPRFTTFEQDCLDELELDSAEDEAGARSDGGSGMSKDDFVDTWSSQQSSHRLWLAFQHTASSISSLYRDQCTASTTGVSASWYSFQTAAEACTDMYKESQEILRVSVDEARREGRKQLIKDLVMWMKKRGRRGRHFRREELLAFLSGKAPPPAASMRPTIMSSGGAASGVGGAVSSSPAASLNATSHLHHSHRKGGAAFLSSHCLSDAAIGGGNVGALHHHHHHHHHPHPHHRRSLSASPSLTDANVWMPTDFATSSTGFLDGKNENNNSLQQSNSLFLEPDLRSFRDAQTVQGLSGALSNIRVAGSPHSPHGGGGSTPPLLLTATGGASPLRHTASPFDPHNNNNHRVRSSTPSGRQTPVSSSSSSSSSGRGVAQEDYVPYEGDHATATGLHAGAAGGGSPSAVGENADPLLTTLSGYRKRSSSQSTSSSSATHIAGGGSGGAHNENYSTSAAESPTRKRHRLV